MTRKKFIKMLMWAGMSRNDAADCATLAQDAQRPYFWVLGDLLNWHRQDFGNPLAWIRMRRTIIHGYNTPVCRFYREIDEAHTLKDDRVADAIEAGTAAKPGPVIVVGTSATIDKILERLRWPNDPQPAAGCLYAIAPAPVEESATQWPKQNPIDIVDALRYSLERMQAYAAGGAYQ